MAKRFGRNQRRHLRDRVAVLEQLLGEQKYAGWKRAEGRFPPVGSLGEIVGYSIAENVDRYQGSLEVTVSIRNFRLDRQTYDHLTQFYQFEWDDLTWLLKSVRNVELDGYGVIGRHQTELVELTMMAIPDRPIPHRSRLV